MPGLRAIDCWVNVSVGSSRERRTPNVSSLRHDSHGIKAVSVFV